jgi:hypothetical protein
LASDSNTNEMDVSQATTALCTAGTIAAGNAVIADDAATLFEDLQGDDNLADTL